MDGIEHDFEVLEAIGERHGAMSEALISSGRLEETIRRWIVGRQAVADEPDDMVRILAMALDLALFTPSLSGATPAERHLRSEQAETALPGEAVRALLAAQFRLLRIVARETPDLVRLQDLVTREELVLLNSSISPLAAGLDVAMRLCPLASGRCVVVTPLFALDEAALADAMGFVKPGRGLSNTYRCAAALYRDVARRGAIEVPLLADEFVADVRPDERELTIVEQLALRWLAAEDGETAMAESVNETRQITSVDNLVDALGCFGRGGPDAPKGLLDIFARIAEIQMETMMQRARAGMHGYGDSLLDRVAAEIDRFIAARVMERAARGLFDRLKTRLLISGAAIQDSDGTQRRDELARVVQRILALREKTVDQGCTEEEAMAAASKVAELLDRYDLTLDDVSVRNEACAGLAVNTNRRRASPIDTCVQPVAAFCDCRAWSEKTASGDFRYVFFGLKADVEAARFLHELIESTFETETTIFRESVIYQALQGGERRSASNSFQVGLANGIVARLRDLKAARSATMTQTTGYDLVTVKRSVVEDELEKLGLNFTTKTFARRRFVHGASFHAGKTAGERFEPFQSLR